MGIMEKVASAKKTSWVAEGLSDAEIKTTIELAKISAKIEKCRIDLEMTQKEFAEYMGVTQGMVSKWESREYNFTIRSLNEISEKLNISLGISLETKCEKNDYTIIKWDEDEALRKTKNSWFVNIGSKEAIA
ncbi:MAG: helix-turn-helix transcriptional regulator [Eubacteriales bacterium]|nr:helix-turn-helix transcriptional regulator [Eubacteriales bacterium]